VRSSLAYLMARIIEPSTWIGLALVLAGVVLLWVFRDQVIAAATSVVTGAALAGIPQRLMSRPLFSLAARTAVPSKQEPKEMSTIAESLETVALEAVKAAALALPEPAATLAKGIITAVENPSAGNIIAAIVDAAKVVEDLLAQVEAAKATTAATNAQPEVQS
jgi:hypothetical protein